jgi:penicillin-binding protein 2
LPEQVDDLGALLKKLGAYINLDDDEMRRIERDMKERNGFNAIIVRDNLTRNQMDTIAVHSPDLIGIDIDAGEVRAYPYGETTAHILGYVGPASRSEAENSEDTILSLPGFHIGKNGAEKQYEKNVRGEAGDVELEVNARGRVVRELMRHDPKVGEDLTLALDIGLQQYVQQRVMREAGAAAVVLNVHSGEILAMVSQPGFDPNLFTFGIGQSDWDSLNKDIHAPLLNKVISGVYAPGSTFKPITALAALEADIVDPNARVYCPGHYELGGHVFHCWKKGGHGYVNMVDAFAGSCDTYFYDLSKRVGIDKIQAMALRFGFGKKLDVDLPHERPGFVPNRFWKKTTRHQEWQQGETLVTGIGQGFLLTSPLQLAIMAARIANNGFAVKPHVAQKVGEKQREAETWPSMGLNPKHLALVREGMFNVVNTTKGTAFGARIKENGMEMAGKTGSAQVRRISVAEHKAGVIKNEDLPWKERDHALFVAYAPVSSPRYAAAVVVEHGGSGAGVAAPIARDILKECQIREG